MKQIIELIHQIVCGLPTTCVILSVGLYLTFKTKFAQARYFPHACSGFIKQFTARNNQSGATTSYQALCTALAATVGTGNMAGVAGAISIGGPGAVFWMWVCAMFGMIIKFAEVTLALHFRNKDTEGNHIGGIMYVIEGAFGREYHWLAVLYCIFGVIASFGIGNAAQINTVSASFNNALIACGKKESLLINCLLGVVLALPIACTLVGGVKRIGKITEQLVPVAAVFYMLMCTGVLILRCDKIAEAFLSIIKGAFSPSAITGGMIGSVFQALRVGASRGVFTNEAGLGTAAMAHASAHNTHPVEQGMMGIVEVFIDTIVICTMSALVILCCDLTIRYGTDSGISLTNEAFSSVYGNWICVPITISLALFAIAAAIGWGLYGARCIQFLLGTKAWKPYVFVHAMIVVLSTCMQTETIWKYSEIMNGLMAFPNLFTLVLLSSKFTQSISAYRISKKKSRK